MRADTLLWLLFNLQQEPLRATKTWGTIENKWFVVEFLYLVERVFLYNEVNTIGTLAVMFAANLNTALQEFFQMKKGQILGNNWQDMYNVNCENHMSKVASVP